MHVERAVFDCLSKPSTANIFSQIANQRRTLFRLRQASGLMPINCRKAREKYLTASYSGVKDF
jgi:hypothetical protein